MSAMTHLLQLARAVGGDHLRRLGILRSPLPEPDELHLQAAMDWLRRAVQNGKGGVSSHYDLLRGRWRHPFPETTGYIIPTFFDYHHRVKEPYFFEAAVRLTDWLGEVQLENGACMQGAYDERRGPNPPIIFNTGQNIFGFLRAFNETGKEAYLGRAIKAGDFLVHSTDEKGIFNRYLHQRILHAYNARTAWALLELHRVTGKPGYRRVALANLDWTVSRQQANGWFADCHFKPGEYPNTHGIAYTLRGLLESYRIVGEPAYLKAVERTSEPLLALVESGRPLYAFWDADWQNRGKYFKLLKGRYICLTGNVQLAIVWLRLFTTVKADPRLLCAANRLIDEVKTHHDIHSSHPGIRGGVKGSFPITGAYSFLKYPNWAAKFLADALMLRLVSAKL